MIVPKMTPKKMERYKKIVRKGRENYQKEEKYPWLKDLLDAYFFTDSGVMVELDSQVQKSGREVACGKGCQACCLNPTVKINNLEIRGISWYLCEEMSSDNFKRVIQQLKQHQSTTACPFLLDGICSIYPVRPLACRITYVFETKCKDDEDVYMTRPDDLIYTHGKDMAWIVAQKMLPHLTGDTDETTQRYIFDSGYMFQSATEMHLLDWEGFAERSENIREKVYKM
nr:YkgJ family cysteine cluster protein [Paenibacillus xylanexedens]